MNQIITMSLSSNHQYHTRSKDTINADPLDLLSAVSKAESNLMQNITNLKYEVINLQDIIIKHIQDESKSLKNKVNVLENKIIDLEIQNNNVDQYSRRSNNEISGIAQSVRNSQLGEKVAIVLGRKKMLLLGFTNREHSFQALRNKKTLKSIDKNHIGIPNVNLFISENLTPLNSKLSFNCKKLKRDGEIEKYYTINGIVHIAKNNKIMKIYHLKDLQEHFPEHAIDNSDHAE